MGMERLEPQYRYRQNTSMVARGLSSAGNAVSGDNFFSPVQIDHLVKGYFSWLGTFIVGGADMLVRSISDEPTKPALDMWKFSTGGIVSSVDSNIQSKYVNAMYDQAAELEQAYGTWKMLKRTGKHEEAMQYRKEHKDEIRGYRKVEHAKRQMTIYNERIRMIERSSRTPDEKRRLIIEMNKKKEKLAKQLYY